MNGLQPPKFGDLGLDAAHIKRLIRRIKSHTPDSYLHLMQLLRILYTAELPEESATQARACLLNFNYRLPAVSSRSLTAWAEHRQLCYATNMLLAGSLYLEQPFVRQNCSGKILASQGEHQVRVWLADRFRFGFSQWLSNTALAYDVAALTLLIDHAESNPRTRSSSPTAPTPSKVDPAKPTKINPATPKVTPATPQGDTVSLRAKIVLDMLLVDASSHSFEGNLAAAGANAVAGAYQDPASTKLAEVLSSIIDPDNFHVDLNRLSAIFATRINYQVPGIVRHLATCDHERQVYTSQGLDLDEVVEQLARHPDYPRTDPQQTARFLGSMNALGHPRVADLAKTSATKDRRPLVGRVLPRTAARLSRVVSRIQNPVSAGAALQRANIQTFRTANYLLSSAQRYQPGQFGADQHLWHARLKGGINVFGNHPRSISSQAVGYWNGNGLNPDLAQRGNVLLAIHDLHSRSGKNEGERAKFTHFYFPFVQFDETRIGPHWVVGRRANSYVAIMTTHQLEQVSEIEIIHRGMQTGYVVIVSDDEEFGSIAECVRALRSSSLSLEDDVLTVSLPFEDYSLTWKGPFKSMGVEIKHTYDRHETNMTATSRFPRRINYTIKDHSVQLDWDKPARVVEDRASGECPEKPHV